MDGPTRTNVDLRIVKRRRQHQSSGIVFSRLRRAEIGIHHYVAGPYLSAYANEMAWRENNRRASKRRAILVTPRSWGNQASGNDFMLAGRDIEAYQRTILNQPKD